MAEPVEGVVEEPRENGTSSTCCECDEPVPERCLKHEALHALKTKGRQWLMARATEWMAESEKVKRS